MIKIPFKRFGVMLDMSRNAVMKPDVVKAFADEIASMGYNTLLLYTEDTYEIKEDPYFGARRGRYTKEDIRSIVAHCDALGMEVIPCIQTLAHMKTYLDWRKNKKLVDTGDIFLTDSEEVYALIRKMIRALRAAYTTKSIHVGMDEAHLLGLGKHLDLHGYESRFDILRRHLEKVCRIAKEEGFEPNIWSDMFFRLGNGGLYSLKKPHLEPSEFGELPEGLNLTYWNYYSTERSLYRAMLRAHKKFQRPIWFAGGAWSWKGWAPDNRYTVMSMFPGLSVAMEEGIENAFITTWGDNGGECSRFALLPSLFACARFVQGEKSMRVIKEEFKEKYGISYGDFESLDLRLDPKRKLAVNPEKYLLYNDPFIGKLDSTVTGKEAAFYRRAAAKFARLAKKGVYPKVFTNHAALSRTLSYKAELGVRTRALYQAGDKEGMKALLKEYTLARQNLKRFIQTETELWHWENRPQGFEIQEARLGGLLLRLSSCQKRLESWIETGEAIPELEEPALAFMGNDPDAKVEHLRIARYHEMITASSIK